MIMVAGIENPLIMVNSLREWVKNCDVELDSDTLTQLEQCFKEMDRIIANELEANVGELLEWLRNG